MQECVMQLCNYLNTVYIRMVASYVYAEKQKLLNMLISICICSHSKKDHHTVAYENDSPEWSLNGKY